ENALSAPSDNPDLLHFEEPVSPGAMPTYEFRCPKGHDFEKFYKTMSTAPSELPCPECGAVAVRQLSGGGGLVFKGSGFYLTDYGKNAHRGGSPEKKGDGGEKSDGRKSEGGKPEGGKSEGSKGEGGKSEGSKPDSAGSQSAKAESAKSESAKSKAESPKPKSE